LISIGKGQKNYTKIIDILKKYDMVKLTTAFIAAMKPQGEINP